MDNLVITALQEGGINCAERFETICRETCREGHSMLLSNADIKHTVRESFAENIHARTAWHSGGYTDNFIVFFCLLDELTTKDGGIARCIRDRLALLTRNDIEF